MAFDRGNNTAGTGSASVLSIQAGGTNANTALTAFSNLSEGKVVVASSGNVGIGTSSPANKLDVEGSSFGASTRLRLTSTSASGSGTGSFIFNRSSNASMGAQFLGTIGWTHTLTDSSSVEAANIFVTGSNVAGSNTGNLRYDALTSQRWSINNSERMRIDATGNVGIGTSSPTRPLHVNDVMRLQPRNGAPSSPGAGDIYFDSADNKLKCYDGSVWQDLF